MASRRRDRERKTNILSPSDFLLERPRGTVHVGGRVVAVDGKEWTLEDALAAITVRVDDETEVGIGDLVVLDVRRVSGRFRSDGLVARSTGKPPTANSEFGRLAGGSVGRALAARALARRVARDYFDDQGFMEVETPIRVKSPGLDAYVDAVRAGDGWLITSPELSMKRLLVGGLPRIYQFSPVTRAGEEGDWHAGEFSMLEWYRAFSTMGAVVTDTESLVLEVVRALSRRTSIRAPTGKIVDLRPPFVRMTVRDAFRRYAGIDDAVDLASSDVDRYFQTFVDRVEPAIAEHERPLVLTEFPTSLGALARRCSEDASVCERFEVYVGGIELSNGFGELTDPIEQRRRFVAERERRARTGAPDQPIDERFLEALEEGLPPSGGNALGFDRLVALALELPGIAHVIAFPRERL